MLAFRAVLLTLTLGLTSCGDFDSDRPENSNVELRSAEEAWSRLISGYSNQSTPEPLSLFQRQVLQTEQHKRWFRDEGIKFWTNYPEALERFDWLSLAAYFEPFYPVDEMDWLDQAEQIGPNTSERSSARLAEWDAFYSEARVDFFSSDEVSVEDKRELRSIEVSRALLERQRAKERGTPAEPKQELLKMVREFLGAYPAPTDETEAELLRYVWDRNRVIAPAFGWHGVLDLGQAEIETFFTDLEESSISWFPYDAGLNEQGQFYVGRTRDQLAAFAQVQDLFVREGISSWTEWRGLNEKQDTVWDAIIAFSGTFPSRNQIQGDFDTRVIESYEIWHSLTLFRGLGTANIEQMSLDDKVNWLIDTTWRFNVPADNGLAWALANHRGTGQFLAVDDDLSIESIRVSNAPVSELLEATLLDPALKDDARAALLYRRAQLGLYEAGYIWRAFGDRSFVERKLEEIVELDLVHGESRRAADLLRIITRGSDEDTLNQWGYTRTEMTSILLPLLENGGQETQEFTSAYIEQKPLSLGDTVLIEAPTLEGEEIVSTRDYAGYVVLVDNWDTNCAPCIRAFPSLQRVLGEYYDRGFRIMSIAYDAETNRDGVLRIKDRLDLTWETLNGEGLWPSVSTRYQVTGFPQYMLLDREGRFIAGNEEIGDTTVLPTLLDNLLNEH